MQENELTLRREFESMTSEQLRTILHTETEKNVPDDDLVLAILHILEEREPDVLISASSKEEAAWRLFQKRVKSRRRNREVSFLQVVKVASIVLILGLLIAVVPQNAQAESLWDILMRWTRNAVEYFNPTENNRSMQFEFVTGHQGMQQIYDAAVEMGIERPLIPMWFPEEYVLDRIEAVNMPREHYFTARLVGESNSAIFQVTISERNGLRGYFGEKEFSKEFEREGAQYKMMRNNSRWVAIWTLDRIEYSVAMDCQEDTLQRILDSIYVMEE